MRTIFLSVFLACLSFLCRGQITVSGFVKDAKTGEALIGAYIINEATLRGTTTNNYGFFSISETSNCILRISFIGYKEQVFILNSKEDTLIDILLAPGFELDEVTIKARIQQPFNISTLSVKEIQQIPSLGGVPDVFKAMQLLPGIQSQSEASSMLIVRGGSPGQNMYLLDNTPLIYVNHLGGFLSVFNPDMINDVSILKGGFPAQYGGKLSSIVNITQRCGDTSEFKGSFGIGITDVNLSMEGPLGEKTSYIFTGRKTLYDLLLYAGSSFSAGNSSNVAYGFHDLNGKITFKLNKRNNIFFNIYQGDDYYNAWSKSESDFSNEKSHLKNVWGNWLFAGNWTTIASTKLFGETGVSYTSYRLKDKQTLKNYGDYDYSSKFTSSVHDLLFRTNWNYRIVKKYSVKFGANHSLLNHAPYEFEQKGFYNSYSKSDVSSMQTAFFIDNKINPFKFVELNLGIRASNYAITGFNKIYFEPRVNITFNVGSNHRVNITYMQVNQTSHLLFASGNGIMSTEVWIPATNQIRPSESQQFSLGHKCDISNKMFSAETNVYYKQMQNLATYKEGIINIKNSQDWETAIETEGSGISYGLELFVKKNYGEWKGSVGYTWSQTTRQFDNINNGKTYWYEYHRPNTISIIISREITKKWSFNALWVYQTGLPYTPAIGRQYIIVPNQFNNNGNPIYQEAMIYGERNIGKMKDYHRLDIGFIYNTINKRGRKVLWNFSVYNLYNRHNPNMYYYNNDKSDVYQVNESSGNYKPLNLYQVSLFPFIPSVSYKIFF